eukprot:403344429
MTTSHRKLALLSLLLTTSALGSQDSLFLQDPNPPYDRTKNDKIGFVFEIVRHGARAPLSELTQPFNVPAGMLTSQGQRQRYLLGKLNRQRYIEEAGLLDPVFNPQQLYIQSTYFFRTVQSSYAEMMGMFPPIKDTPTMTEGEKQSLKTGKGMPKLKIRNMKGTYDEETPLELNDDPDLSSQYVPVFTYYERNPKDDVFYYGCHYTEEAQKIRQTINDTFRDEFYLMPITRGAIQRAFSFSNYFSYHMSYAEFNTHSDIILSETFENLPKRVPFYTEEEWHGIRMLQKYILITPFEGKPRSIYITKMFRKPLIAMEFRYQEIVKGLYDNTDTLRYYIYSAHDTQIANVMEFLFLSDYDGNRHQYSDVPYASTLFFELHYDLNCLATSDKDKLRDCFSVHLTHNGEVVYLPTCVQNNIKKGNKAHECSYQDFLDHITAVSFQGDYMKECAADYLG